MIKVVCDKCKHEFSIFSKYCPSCGDIVKITSKFYCDDCGNEIDIYEKRCNHCDRIPEKVRIKSEDGKEIVTSFDSSDDLLLNDPESYVFTDSDTLEKNEEPNEIKNYSPFILGLGICALIATFLRLFYLASHNVFNVFSILAVVAAILLLVFINKRKASFIIGIVTGALMFISGSIIGAIIGILLIIDSIRELVKEQKNTNNS